MKYKLLIFSIQTGIYFILIIFILSSPVFALQFRYVEDFTSTLYKDTLNTTADWDTVNGELKLHHFEPILTASYATSGLAYGVAISGDYAYVTDASFGMQVIDISDPSTPTLAGSFDTQGTALGVAIDGNYAFVAAFEAGLQVIDIRSPISPFLAGSYNTPGYAYDVTVDGDFAFIADFTYGLQVIDISNPASPSLAGTYNSPGTVYNVVVCGDYAYLADGSSGLQVIDITDPANPVHAGNYDTPGIAYGVYISGDNLFVADDDAGLQVINITDPTNPVLTGNFDTPGYAQAVFIDGNYAYVADNIAGIKILDISDPANPVDLGSYDTPGNAQDVVVDGIYAFVADYNTGLQILKIAEHCTQLRLEGSYITSGNVQCLAIDGDYAYVGTSSNFQIINISTPSNPVVIGSYNYYDITDIEVFGKYLFINGSKVLDVSDPINPALVGSLLSGHSNDLVQSGNYAFITSDDAFFVNDISNPASPNYVIELENSEFNDDILVEGNYLFMNADIGSYISVLNINNPEYPIVVGTINTGSNIQAIAINGDYAYITDTDGLLIFDITTPTVARYIGNCNTPGLAEDITISGNHAYIADGDYGLVVIDISDPTNPILVNSYDTPGEAQKVVLSDDFAYVVDSDAGLQIIKIKSRSLNIEKNNCQSIVVNEITNDIARARITTSQTDSVLWELSPDNGLNWDEIQPDYNWYFFSALGDQLLWRSTHVYQDNGINPTCSHLEIEWLYSSAEIDSIVDVPDDQGGWLRVYFTRSGRDFTDDTSYPVTNYYVFRRIDDIGLQKQILQNNQSLNKPEEIKLPSLVNSFTIPKSFGSSKVFNLNNRYFIKSSAKQATDDPPPGTWEIVGWAPAHQQDQYICLVPSLADSSTDLVHSVYCISAETTTPSVYYYSMPDSAYSIDNIAPSAPQSLQAMQVNNHSVQLNWDINTIDHDWHYFAVHRSLIDNFIPDESSLLEYTTNPAYSDDEPYDHENCYYKIISYDNHNNASLPSPQAAIFFDSSLPVSLINFTANSPGDSVIVVNFSTASEIELAGFNILRSESENENYQVIATYKNNDALCSKGNNSSGEDYCWKDRTAKRDIDYWYQLHCIDLNGKISIYGPVQACLKPLPEKYVLYQNYPNPFNPITNITYDLPVKSDVKIEVYNILGQRITILTDKRQDPGNYHITWNSNSQAGIYIASGVYILQFRAAGIKDGKIIKFSCVRKMLLVR